jgi:aspartate 1-decarboxylase
VQLTMLKAKIHRAHVTQTDLHYEGSITIDEALLEAAGILPFERVDVLNINNGERFTTYAIKGPRGSGIIGINGAAARLAQPGDLVIICCFAQFEVEEAELHQPEIVLVTESNAVLTHPVTSGN